ncbi:cilia- and flagella-associated protein 100 [Dromaius novaehollandiae]|uniref:cilia- and flagella-associated protein 100 n=1 Tax=Dromaius novaehollandiae TaxID=8790 RepID=UPI00311F3C0D
MSSPPTKSSSESLSSQSGMETQPVLSESSEDNEENSTKNPFTIPPDIDIFSIRDKEREKAKKERERSKTMKIHEKMTYSTKINVKQKGLRKALQKEEEKEDRKQAAETERLKAYQDSLSWKTALTKDQHLEKESFRDYVNNRRQIFLLEYTMAVKRDEIQRLEKLAKTEERKLEKAEHYLEKDAVMFDEFLKENDKNSVQALRIAERETAAKTEKIMEIQSITSQIMNLESDISKFEDTLQEYKRYRDFLYQLSPKEWQEEYAKKHAKERESKTASKAKEESASPHTTAEKGKCQGRASQSLLGQSHTLSICPFFSPGQDLTVRTKAAHLSSTSCLDAQSSLLSSESSDFRLLCEIGPEFKDFLKPLSTVELSLVEDQESETCSDEEDELELYFTDPQQLLSIFTELEEQNLSLIQNSQDTEETLDELRHTLIATSNRMDQEIEQLKQLTATVKSSIAKEEKTAADLKLRVRVFSFGEYKADVQDKMLANLNKKVLEVYRRCIGENEANLGTLQMLAVIEKQMDDLLECLERIPSAKIEQAEKAKEKERRIRLREEKIRQQKLLQEERLQRALARAQADIKKKTGRRLVFRSDPPAKKEKQQQTQEQMDEEKQEQLYYFT